MPKLKAKLTDVQIRNLKPGDKAYKVNDEGGLVILVRPTGTKVFQYPYKMGGKYNVFTIGQYPDMPAVDARKQRDLVRDMIKQGINPNQKKQIERQLNVQAGEQSFEAIARNWHGKQIWAAKHKASILSRLENDVFPKIGYKHINQVNAQEILAILYDIEARGSLDMVRRVNQYCVAIFDHGIAMGLCEFNPAIGRTKAIKSAPVKHRPYLKESQLPDFLQRLDNYSGGMLVQLALKLLLLTFVRPGELRGARWDEINLDKAEWKIPAARMKMKRDHIVPLSTQAVEVIKQIQIISGRCEIIFPGERKITKPISDVTLTKALIIMGYTGENKVVPHGFRATASTILNEKGFKPDVIERQLAHVEKNKVRASYHHSEYLDDRRHMMQWWGDYILSVMPA
jgi:integrase